MTDGVEEAIFTRAALRNRLDTLALELEHFMRQEQEWAARTHDLSERHERVAAAMQVIDAELVDVEPQNSGTTSPRCTKAEPEGVAFGPRASSPAVRVERLLAPAPDAVRTAIAVHAALPDIVRKTIDNIMNRWSRAGVLERVGRGRYRIAASAIHHVATMSDSSQVPASNQTVHAVLTLVASDPDHP